MKSPAAYYLMLLYVMVIFKPLMPILQDVWSHDFKEAEHISVVHSKYCRNHQQKELAADNDENDHNRNHNVLKSQDETSFHVLTAISKTDLSINRNERHYLCFNPGKLAFVFIFNPTPPPRFS